MTNYKPYLSLIVIVVLFAAFWIAIASTIVFNLAPPLASSDVENKNPTVKITLYAGESPSGQMGFGTSATNITSPGPTLRFSINDIVSLTLINSGKTPHAFAITDIPKTGGKNFFNAAIGSSTNPLGPGEQMTVVFAPTYSGSNFYYTCPVSGQAEAGMWGSVVVSGV